LSLNFFFTKVARDKNEKGKGGYWELMVDNKKTARKRIRQRKKKTGLSASPKVAKLLKSSRASMAKAKRQQDDYEAPASYVESNMGSDSMISSPSDMIEEEEDEFDAFTDDPSITTVEIIEEQQNINNIIDDNQNTIIISNPIFDSPNVIVEAIPSTYQFSHFNHIDNFDETELSHLICMDDQELIDDFLRYNERHEEFI